MNLQHPDITRAEETGYAHNPFVAFTCDECGEDIYAGEDYYDVAGGHYCRWCMEHTMRKEATA